MIPEPVNTQKELVRVDPVILRSKLYKAIRSFFYEQEFVEVSTPIRIPTPALEDYIDAESSGNHYLRTSPELYMKRLILRGYERIFQIGPCFRKGENGRLHQPEFTMLEWYFAPGNYQDIQNQTVELLHHVVTDLNDDSTIHYGSSSIEFNNSWENLTVHDAFEKFARIDPLSALKKNRYEEILAEKIEPNLGILKPTFLVDYPIECAALAKAKPSNPLLAERWELYLGGLEIANAYSELTDSQEQLKRFQECAIARSKRKQKVYPIDFDFIKALELGMPPCTGCALGIDRLLMILANANSIDEVQAF